MGPTSIITFGPTITDRSAYPFCEADGEGDGQETQGGAIRRFEEIRREHAHGAGTIRAVAKGLGVHRRMVRQPLASAIPPEHKLAVRNKPRLGPVMEFIDEILHADQLAPRKQRHTAHRIWQWIRQERAERVAEAKVRCYVRERRQEVGLTGRDTCPSDLQLGGEAQVDRYEAVADFAGERLPVNTFAMHCAANSTSSAILIASWNGLSSDTTYLCLFQRSLQRLRSSSC